MKKNIEGSAKSVEQKRTAAKKQLREDFFKRIRRLMNDANILQGRMVELINDLDEYVTDLDEDEDAGLQEALHEIDYAVDGINECIHHVDRAYDNSHRCIKSYT